jgi:hypothetical protein
MAKTDKPEQQAADIQFDANAQVKLDAAHDLVQHPDKFAEIFVKAAETQTKIKEYVRKEIKDSLESDSGTRNAMKGLIKEQFKEDWKAFVMSSWGKVSLGVWTLVVAVISAWLGHLFK